MRLKLATALLALTSLALSACGFTPVYGNLNASEQGNIQISEISGASGHTMRQELVLLLRPGIPSVESGMLTVTAKEGASPFAIAPDSRNVRTVVRVSAEYTFVSDAGEFEGEISAESSFYAGSRAEGEILAQRSAAELAAKEAARKLVADLIAQVGRKKASETKSTED